MRRPRPPLHSVPREAETAPAEIGGSDSRLIRQAQAGDRGALHELLASYEAPLLRFASRMLGPRRRADVYDLCQEVFVRIIETIDRADPSRPFKPYFYRIASNLIIDSLRSEMRRGPVVHRSEEPAAAGEDPGLRIDLERAILELPVNYRTVLVLRYAEELDYEEIAATLQIPLNTVKTYLFRARRALKTRLGDQS